MAIIDIYTCLAGNSAPYADMLRKNMTSLQSGRHTLRFHAMISASDAETVGIPNGWGIIPVNLKKCHPKNISTPAVNHAKLLNSIEQIGCSARFSPIRTEGTLSATFSTISGKLGKKVKIMPSMRVLRNVSR